MDFEDIITTDFAGSRIYVSGEIFPYRLMDLIVYIIQNGDCYFHARGSDEYTYMWVENNKTHQLTVKGDRAISYRLIFNVAGIRAFIEHNNKYQGKLLQEQTGELGICRTNALH